MINLSTIHRNLACDTISNLVSTSATAKAKATGTMQIWQGHQPQSADAPPQGILLGTLPFGAPAFNPAGTTGPGIATAVLAGSKGAVYLRGNVGSGILSWFRVLGGANGQQLFDGSIAVSGGDLTVPNVNVGAGVMTVSAFQLAVPASAGEGSSTFLLSTACRNAVMDAITKSMNGPATNVAILKIYSGTQPTSADLPSTSQLLAVMAFSATAFQEAGIVDAGMAVNNQIAQLGQNVAPGLMTWGRIQTGSGSTVLDFSIGPSNADLIVDSCTVQAGGVVSIQSLTLTF